MSSNPRQLDVLGPAEKRALLAQLLKEKASKPRSFPLSYAQQRLWFLDQMNPGTDAYNIPSAMRLRGTLDIPTLTRSLNEIVRRHEALRTTFAGGEGEPVQIVARAAALNIPLVELRAEDASEREAELQRLIREETAQAFNLARGPLLRVKLLQVADDDHVLLLTLHHIICDGWSIGVFMGELAALYEAYASGQESPLARLPIQYADYARWQREWLQGEVLEQQLSYWKEQLAGAPAVLELPTDRPRSERTQPGAYSTFRITTETTKGLNELSRKHGATLFMTLLAAFQTLLFRYSGQDDIVVGSPIAGRNRAETENLIGFFINTLVMRTSMSGDPSFRELLQRVKETALGAYAHQDVPFERLVEELQPERSLSYSPIFQVMLAVQHARSARLQLPGVSLETMAVGTEAAKFDLMLLLAEDAEGLEARLEYNRDLFEAATIARLIGHFEVLVESVLSNPEQRLSELQLLTPAEREQLLVDWNQTATNYSQHQCIHQVFEEQVQRTPDNTALVCGEQRLSYAALNRKANQLAHHLRSVGVGPEVLVGVCMERSIEMMVALLGILKAGGAYLPLDPTYPRARLAFMLEDAAVPVLLTQARLAECIPQTAASILSVDADWEQFSQLSAENPGIAVTPENLAYVIYTSGSTGQPKGVEVQHGGLINLVSWHQREYGVTPLDRATQLSGPSFDASVWEVWPYLAAGASLYIPDAETRVSAAKLVDWITAESITITFLPTPLAEAVLVTLEEQWPAGCTLRNILTGGDQLQRWPRTALPLSLTNHYGPTENTVVTTSFEVATRVEAGPVLPPIGRPIANTEVYILDQYQQPVPIGVAGELHIGGDGLARGYLKRPELSAERFIPHPFSFTEGARLYKTGDLASYLPDGNIEFRGRIDKQVKVRGFRIELGEIEAALIEHPSVRECVLAAREDEPGEKRLVAYIVGQREQPLPVSELRGYLGERLPDHMIPAAFVLVDELPLTPNGKIDRRALPAPDNTRPELESSFTAPRTLVEQRLAQIWAEVLHLSEVGIADNFFALGGHSLLVMQVMARVRKSFQIELPVRSLFESPTIERLAQRVETALRLGQNLPAPPIVPVSREQNLPLSFAQQRMWFLAQMEPDVAVYNIPAAVRMTGSLNIAALERSFSEVVRRHEALRTTFVAHDGIPVQVIHEAGPVAIPVLDLSGLAEKESEAQRLIREEARRPFDLARGPLLRVGLLRLRAEEYVLLLTLHHIVSDAWSTEVLVREITTLYQAYVAGEEPGLTELAVQYADYAAWQREWLQGEVLEAQLFYWRRQLGELPEVLELPTKGPRPAVQTYRAGGHGLLLSAPQKGAFQALAYAEGTTLFITLLAAFQTLLWHYTRQEQVSVGTPTAGRDRVEIEGLIGCFVNTLVMATDLSGDPTFREVLQRVKEVALGAYAHQDVPFERLVEELQPERSLSHSPLFQVMMVLQNTRNTQLQLPGVSLDTIELDSETVKFDLMLTLTEAEPETNQGLEGRLGYNTDLFEAETIARMVGHFEVLVESVLSNPDQRLSELQLLTAVEREQLLVGFNQTEVEYPQDDTLAQLFEQQAAGTPEAVALVYEAERVSYGELNRRANQLARHLQGLGVGPEVVVGLCIERSPEMVMGLLGILKAGGAYLPLDPAYPAPRLAFMMADAQAQVLLTQQRLLEGLGEQQAEVLCLDADWESFTRHSDENLEVEVQGANLAYVIYTSGSTGQPKGVMISQQAICNHMRWMQESFPLSAADAVLQKTPFSFDASVWEFYAPLFAGARLVLAQPGGHQDSGYLVQTMATEGVTVLQVVPTLLQMLVQESGLSECRDLKRVFCGGEILTRGLAGQLQARLAGVELYNLYGPTEAAIDVTCWPCEREGEWSEWSGVPIGRAIANVQLYVLDQTLKLAPVGVSGELYISGAGLGRGYVGRAELTAERFVPHSYSNEPGARLYRTGDVAHYRSDGALEYVGRVDHQVKVRGYRIELDEIKAALLASAQVREAVVVVRGDGAAQQLVAYVVCADGAALTSAELRVQLQEQLPDYMVPSQYVLLDELPLTPSGKIDRRALPAPDNTRPELESSFTAPRTLVEQRLAQIWAEVLHLTEVGIADNFFSLGGHSLLVMQVMARVRKAFQIELPLRSLFESPTIAGLAQRVETALRLGQNLPAPPIVPVSREQSLPLSFAQQRMWFLAQLEPDVAVYNIPAAVRMTGDLNIAALERSFSEVVRRHEALRTTFVAHDGIPVQVVHEAEAVTIPVLDLSGLAEKESEAQRLIREEGRRPFDLARGPLLRVGLLQLGAEEYVLLLTLHHIVSDAWSTEVLVREITTLYQAYVAGEEPGLAELAVQYADYAAWQREWLQGEVLEAQLFYWRRQLGELPEVLELPTKGPRPAVQTYRAGGQGLLLSAPQKEAFQALAYAEGTTLFITLLAAFQTLLWHYTRQEQVSVGTPTAGRDRVEIEGLIGCFVNTLVIATDLSGDPTFREVLQRVKEVALGAYAHQDVPFERLVEELQPERSLSHSPLFQVMLVLHNARDAQLQLPGVCLEPLDLDSDIVKFDLMLTLTEAEQGLQGWLRYNTDLFEAETIARMVGHFEVLVESVLSNPEQRLSELQLLSAIEREQLLVEWNHTTAAYPEKSIHELFEEQVERQPDALAVVYGDARISYGELNERANQLAHYLQGLGVGPEVIVGLCVERSVEMVVGLLGILKAGGAYLPLDPSYPRERLAFMLADAEVTVLLTQTHLRDSFAGELAHVVCLDAAGPLLAGYSVSNPSTTATGDNLAYVIYTSGSTGRPKGVLIRRRALTNLGYGLQEAIYQRLGGAGGLRVSVNAPLVFDASVKQLVQLGWGHTLCVIPDEVRGDGEALLAYLEAGQVDVLDATPAQVHLLLMAAGGAELGSVRAVLVGGEAIDESLWALMSGSETTQYYNVYGPTECTVDTTTRRVEERRPSLGRGLGNVDVYVLDRGLKLAPLGVAGELCVGGAGLARGYLQRPELTAEKFIPHPYSTEPGARLYRTGDVARYRSDGALEYVGRVDHQVKVRGYRIELGEVEAALLGSAAVREAVVVVRGDGAAQQLVAYVVCAAGAALTSAELRAELQEQLPDYMVPNQYVLLEQLPLTPGGKVDRRALPAPDNTRPELESSFTAPRTLVEQRLAQIWAEVLHLTQVGIHDNFFALGGHSLLVMQVMARVRNSFQIELPLRSLFESPTIMRLAEHVETALRLGQNLPAPPIVPVSREQSLPLSFAQQRMWFLAQMEPDVAVYNIPTAVRLTGSLNIAALERSFSEVVRRHEALRTTFVAHDGIPVQVIHDAEAVSIPVLDLSGLAEKESEAQRLIREEARRPFDLARGPLLRVGLLQLGAEEYVLLLTLHHIVSDAWSTEVLVREITTLYQAYVVGDEPGLAELAVQYADYAAWQREWLQGEVLEAQLFYWRRQLGELPEVLELPTKGPRPAVQTYRAGGYGLLLSAPQKEAFQALAYAEGTTLFITLLAAFQTLLWHYTRQEQVSVGTPTAGRDRVEIEGLIGCFVNTLVMATDLSGDPSFREVLQRVKEVALGAYAHQDVPFERLVEELQPERSLSHSPLFQVMMVLQNTRDTQLQLPGVSLDTIELESETVKFDLMLTLTEAEPETNQGLEGRLGYNTDLFEAETIARMVGHFEVLVESVLGNPDQRLSELQLLTAAEREQLLGFNQTEVEYPQDDTLAQLFEQQAAQTPEAVALVYEGERVSYGELNRRANQLARHLQGLGVGPEVVVGLCIERSPEMVMGLLGILKAGGAYLPLDPAYPAPRLAFMMADAQAEVLLTQQRLLESLGEQAAEVLCLDADWESFTQHSDENLEVEVQGANLAYVIYTSGSTGQPKGVMISQQAICNHMRWMQESFPLSAADAVLQKTPFSFDASVWEFYAPLFAGGRLVLAQPGGQQDSGYLVQTMATEGVTVLQVVPTLLQMLVQEPGLAECRELKRVFCGGEILTRGLAGQLQARLAGVELYNLYGPTEAAIDVTCWPCEREGEWSEWSGVPIGRAIANVQLYVLDQGLKLAPVGVSGELYIGGAGLARGYHGRAELTAERFIPNPFSTEPGERLYRTGDVARYRADGALEYVGRVDHQVKVRGYRIELGEIKAALLASAAVREAVVVVRDDGAAQQLVAYVVCADGAALTTAELRAELQGQLPDYMVPGQYVLLEQLPLTPSGKVDRRALPAPDNTRPELESSFTAPRTLVEQRLAQIWAEVLHLSEVGIADNFFALGGHSLLVMQVIARVRKAFQIELPLRSLFESPTIAGLAQRVETALRLGQNLPAPPILPVSREQSLPLSFAQQRMWFLAQLEPDVAVYNIPAAVRMTGDLNIAALERSFSEVVRRHEALRTTFVAHDGIPVQVIHDAEAVSIPVLDLSGWEETERESEAQRLIREEGRRPFDLARGPLLRVGLLRLGAEEYVLLLTLHHIVSDAWSTEVLVREITTLYQAYVVGQEPGLTELAVQYADYAAWQREWLQGEVLEAQLFYWRRQLGELPEVLELPTKGPRPAVQTYRAGGQGLLLSAPQKEAFQALAYAEGTTLFITLLAAFQTLLWHYTRQEQVSVGTPTAGRDRVEIEGLIGCFVNTLVMATDLSGDPSFREVLQRVKEVALGAYAHQDVPFERLVEELSPARDLSWTPLFQVMFMLGTAREGREAIQLPGLSFSPIRGSSGGGAKFDLLMWLDQNTEGELKGALIYNADLFAESMMSRMSEHFRILIDAVITKPDVRLSELQLLSATEREQVQVEWNDTQRDYPRESCIHELFEKQVERTPNAIALAYGKEQVSYRELNERANQLAQHLRTLGVRAEVLVGICMERSVGLVVGLLGILKAGGAYVPIDPVYPKDRLASLLHDAKVSILLTEQPLLARLPLQEISVVCLDSDQDVISRCDRENLASLSTPQTLAYMIYTSGSTGEPKGVLTQHSSLVNYIDAARVEFGLGPDDRVLQFAPVSFDTASEEIYTCLTSGATLVLRDELMVSSVPAFLQSCRDLEITVLDLPTAYWHHLTAALLERRLTLPESLRLVILGGEKALPERLAIWHRLVDHRVRLLNTYGPTEATIVSTQCDVSAPEKSETWREVPIGRPVPNAQVYLLDRNLKPVPVGVSGELYIGGEGLARGYFQRPDATAEKFVPDRFSAVPGARLYRSGDLARYLDDGRIEFLGRNDHQVKVRGFRIEVGEIEAILLRQPQVRDAIVIAREDVPGDRRLVAYVVAAQEPEPSVSELRKALQEKLPEYMMPAAFVLLDKLPMTSNGKIDRRALPTPEHGRSRNGNSHVAPRTPTEQRLAAIWAEVLKHEQVGIHDNFFELGGHSLLATQMVLRVRDAFQIELPLRRLFESATVAGLAQEVDKTLDSGVVFKKQVIAPLPRDAYRTKRSSLQRKAETSSQLSDDEEVFVFPASFAQQRLWFLDQLKPDSAVYNISDAVRLSGPLDTDAFERTVNEITRRHEALRTTFAIVDEQPVQVISPARFTSLLVRDISDRPDAERDTEALRLITEEAQRPFNLSQGPLLRVSLLKLGDAEHVLLMTMHHIVSDGWSIGVLTTEMKKLYAAFSAGQNSPLPELPVQYADFAQAQREWLSGQVLDEQVAYWKQQLSGIPAVLELPTDHPRPPIQTFRGATQSLMLSRTLSEELNVLSIKEGVTLFMTMLAAFQTLLYRYTGQDEIAVGTPIAGRTSAETERLIGFFINVLVLSTRMQSDLSFRRLMSQVKETALGAYAHQDVPFEKLVEELQLRRDISRSPLFQVMMMLHNASPGPGRLADDLKMNSIGAKGAISKFELTLSLAETADGLKAVVEYNTDLFEAATIQRLLRHFEVLLQGIVADLDQQLSQLRLLTAPEREQLLLDWNQTGAGYPRHQCIQHLVEEQAARTPEATAVVCGEQRLSYAELNRRANQLAHYLRTQAVGREVGPEVLVGVCMERSVEMVVAQLGILKAGGAYLPLDPSYPQARLSFMLDDAAVPVLLTQARLTENLPHTAASVMRVDADWLRVSDLSVENPAVDVSPENLAYVIYTSGSAGQPKGVEVQHASLINLVTWHQREYNVTSLDRATQLAGPSFDASVWELWPYLAAGASIHIPDQETRVAAAKLMDWMAAESITVTFLPTPLAEAALATLEEHWPAGFTLKNLLTGGDQLQRWPRTPLPLSLINHYGPTENTVVTTSCAVGMRADGSALPPIGRPIANTEVYILDQHQEPVPIGIAGELHIGGASLARGYLKRPELTAERFIPNPFSLEPGARLYKTGDLASYLPDGNIEFRGRIDNQVKVRGFRIELGEIETVFAEHPLVRECVVVARDDERGEKRLVAYIVSEQGQTVGVGELRSHLNSKLPDYMVPAAFVMLDQLPLTPNGKIDRRALQSPGETSLSQHEAYVAPRDNVELQLVQIWEDLLRTHPIGVTDNFFELGGHSLIVVNLMNRIEDRFQRQLPLATLFQRGTIEQLAEALRQQQGTVPQSSLVEIRSGSAKPLFCVHAVGGTVLSYHKLAHLLSPNQAVYGLQSRGLYAEAEPHTRVEDMAADYIEALRVVQPQGPYLLAGHSMGGVIAFEMSQQLQQQGHEVALLALMDSWAPVYIPEQDDAMLLVQFAQEHGLPVTADELLQRPPDEQLTYLVEQAHMARVLPPGVGIEQARRLLHIYKNNVRAIRNYLPQLNPCRITLFRASEHLTETRDPASGWTSLTVQEMKIYDVPGNHISMNLEPHVRTLAERLQNCIDQTSTE